MAYSYGNDGTMNFTNGPRKSTALEDQGKTFRGNQGGYNPRANELYYGGSAGAADEDLQRGRQKAFEATQRGAYQTDLDRSDAAMRGFRQSRGQTMGALALQREAALGNAPSRAEIAGNQAMERSLQQQVAAAGSSRGGPANVAAAQRNAAVNAAGQRAQMVQGIQAERAGEMATARGQYGQTALGAQSQDLGAANVGLGAAGLQQQSELEQRRLNQQGEQFYENQGQHARDQELESALRRQQMADQRGATWRQQSHTESEADRKNTKDIFSTAVSAIGGLFSDSAAKAVTTMGGLGLLGLGGTPASGPAPAGELGGSASHGAVGTQFARSPGAMPMRSDMGAKTPAPMYSDEKAKQKAFDDGVLYAAKREAGAASAKDVPGYMRRPEISEKESRERKVANASIGALAAGPAAALLAHLPGWVTSRDDAADNAAREKAAIAKEEAAKPPVYVPQPAIEPHLTGQAAIGVRSPVEDVGSSFRSDERAKKVIRAEQDFADANRSMEAEPYRYKGEFTPEDQAPGEVNVGPMAQRMARSNVARTAVKEEPNSDLLMIDRDKGLKVVMGGLASLQKQVDALSSARSTKSKRKA